MEINTIVLLVAILTYGIVQVIAISVGTKYLNKIMDMMSKFTDAAIKVMNKTFED